jgi:hypothetical protein
VFGYAQSMWSTRTADDMGRWWRLPTPGLLLACVFLCFLPGPACAQQPPVPAASPQATMPQGQLPGSISGIVIDVGGTIVSGAHVTLMTGTSAQAREATTDTGGLFVFQDITAGDFKLTVTCEGLEPSLASGTLLAGESYLVPKIVLRVATAHTSVDVSLSRYDMAEPEVKAAEQQRLIGAIPNYYVSYDWNAPPMAKRQKFELAWKSTIDPSSFIIEAGFAGIQQWQNDYPGFGRGAQGYGKRFGAGMATESTGNILGGAVLPILFRQDPRYFYKGTGSFWSRAGYALSTAVIIRGDNGRWQPSYSGILGNFGAAGLSNLYYPASSRQGAGLTISNGLVGIGFNGASNLLQEFVLRKLTTHSNKK